jgi:Reverse transcriptase (RNA-dependent DNA polymerase)
VSQHHYVPTNFGTGTIVPLVKDKTGDVSSTNNYRAITLVPVISKLFECVLLHITDEFLNNDDRQFGFKKGLGCANAIFIVCNTVDYSTDRGSTVYAAALDISKAYDCILHVRLFTSLLCTGMPRWVVYLRVDWNSKLQVAVRWMDSLSAYFKVGSGLRHCHLRSSMFISTWPSNVYAC